MRYILALVASLAVAAPAYGQYYGAPPPPPPGYYPAQPGFEGLPPGPERREFERREFERREFEREGFGRRCDALLRTPAGPQHLICRIIEPKPLGEECACPPPPPPPGYEPGPFVGGRTIR